MGRSEAGSEATHFANGTRLSTTGSHCLATWARVRDWRETQLGKLPNVEIFRESEMTAESVLELGAAHVVLATGAHWRRDGFGKATPVPSPRG